MLQFNDATTLESIQENVWCSNEGFGERVPIKLIDGKERDALLKSQSLDEAAALEHFKFVTLTCNRRLTSASKIQMVYGKGVNTLGGVPNSVEIRYNFTVREPFSASFNCERENARSACLPIPPMSLNFNAPVPRKLAEAIRLTGGKDTLKPIFDSEGDEADIVNNISFKLLFIEFTPYVFELPLDFKNRGELLGIDALICTLFGKAAHWLDECEAAVAAALDRGPNAKPAQVSSRACGVLKLVQSWPGCDSLDLITTGVLQRKTFKAIEGLASHLARQLVSQLKEQSI